MIGMNLIIDVGNSFVKLAVFNQAKIIFKTSCELELLFKEVDYIKHKFPVIKKAIVSSVGKFSKAQLNILNQDFELIELTHKTRVPFKNCYETPTTIGIDRIALVSASVFKYPKQNVLIIDAGSCITFDFITNQNNYLGGAISLGVRMRYKALNNFTAKLPLLQTKKPENIIGSSTNSSIHSGVVNGVLYEIDGIINEYKEKYPDLTVILTGGDAKFLSKQLKSSIFANSNFLLEGLNYILQFNSK